MVLCDYANTYIADLVLCFLNSLQLWRVCDHAETFPFILLKILPVENLENGRQKTSKSSINNITF